MWLRTARGVPFSAESLSPIFTEDAVSMLQAGVGIPCQDRERQGCRDRAYRMYLQRVLAGNTRHSDPIWNDSRVQDLRQFTQPNEAHPE